ncbi:phosphoethanolamine--lipid A transferase [Thiomicrorhabdus indica]|uniref:phosphoethanolamine transferase n=1 Tax=Thiomicrorhabdus indica TaxID=2267253 RepID=UPI002AA711CE|nr:phosphoethanolamine--lipid A transferase [Thiomicrorhabdus indica]
MTVFAKRLSNFSIELSYPMLLILLAGFWVMFANQSFYQALFKIYPLSVDEGLFLAAVSLLLWASLVLVLSLFVFHRFSKAIIIILLMVTASSAYFMDSYHTVIDEDMITNILKTDQAEAFDLLNMKLFGYLFFLGIIPSVFLLYAVKLKPVGWKKALLQRMGLFVVSLIIALTAVFSASEQFSSFLREHKSVRYFSNPSFYLYSSAKFIGQSFKAEAAPFQSIAMDAKKIPSTSAPKPKLLVMVVGETARGDHLQINGYPQPTTPNLERLMQSGNLISFQQATSCGTSTAYSVPCMFSALGEDDYSPTKAKQQENVLDVLKRVGIEVLWLDNNSDSKGVADRVAYQSYKNSDINPVCDVECRDEGMLANLDEFVGQHPQKDMVVVLHQMGNHGPAYFKRVPESFRRFTPTCDTNELSECTQDELKNTYDNAILYTDEFLQKTIDWLKNYSQYETAMIYASDHGESLGENGIYLHGLPNFMAPQEQRDIPMLVWMNDTNNAKFANAQQKQALATNHDALFHSILSFMEVDTQLYQAELDWFANPTGR